MVHACVAGADGWDEWFSDLFDGPAKAALPHRQTLLHDVIRNAVTFYLDYSTRKEASYAVDYYRSILKEADIKPPPWLTAKNIEQHIRDLDRLLAKAASIITPSVFFVLFSDREFLEALQSRVAEYVRSLKREDHPGILARDGVLKRPTRLPTWLKAGVFYRDRGRCQHCWKDLSGLSRPVDDLHLDHIIPLAASGSNDPTNFQLSCASCNRRKGKALENHRPKFTPFW